MVMDNISPSSGYVCPNPGGAYTCKNNGVKYQPTIFTGHLTSTATVGYGDLEFRAMLSHGRSGSTATTPPSNALTCISVYTSTVQHNEFAWCYNPTDPTRIHMNYWVGKDLDPSDVGQSYNHAISGVNFATSYNTYILKWRAGMFQWIVNDVILWDSRDPNRPLLWNPVTPSEPMQVKIILRAVDSPSVYQSRAYLSVKYMKFTDNTATLPMPSPFPYSASPPLTKTSSVTTVYLPSSSPTTPSKLRRRMTTRTDISDEMKYAIRDALCEIKGDYVVGIDRCTDSHVIYSTKVTELTGEMEGTQEINVTIVHSIDVADYPEHDDSDEKYAADNDAVDSALDDGSLHAMFLSVGSLLYHAEDLNEAVLYSVDFAPLNTVHSHVNLSTTPTTDKQTQKSGKDEGDAKWTPVLITVTVIAIVASVVAIVAVIVIFAMIRPRNKNVEPFS